MEDHQSNEPRPSKAELEAQLQSKTEAISARMDALREEVEDTPSSLWEEMKKRPLVSLGGALAVGLLVGLWIAGRRKRRLKRSHKALIEQYIDALRSEVRHAVAGGADVDTAVQQALQQRVPLIVYTPEGKESASPGWLRNLFDIVFDTSLALFVREGLNALLGGLDLEEDVAELAALEDE
jgi:ElaB/YqjD/DUF883 family membrane-anchored ribosome-binding protein